MRLLRTLIFSLAGPLLAMGSPAYTVPASLISEADFNRLFDPHRSCHGPVGDAAKDYYSYANLAKAFTKYPFDTLPPLDAKIEWAAFLGHVKQETGNLCFIEQWRCTQMHPQPSDCDYCDHNVTSSYPCNGKQFYGRGAMQVKSNANYGEFSKAYFNDAHVLLQDPARISTDGELSWAFALWYWNCNPHDLLAAYPQSDGGFGATSRYLNPLECHAGDKDAEQRNRVGHFQAFAELLGVSNEITSFNLYCAPGNALTPVKTTTTYHPAPTPSPTHPPTYPPTYPPTSPPTNLPTHPVYPTPGPSPRMPTPSPTPYKPDDNDYHEEPDDNDYHVEGDVECGAPLPYSYNSIFHPDDYPQDDNRSDGHPLVLGMRFWTTKHGAIEAVRWFRGVGEENTWHEGRVYEWRTGKLVATTGGFYSGHCHGGNWMSIPLTQPLAIKARTVYVVVIDNVTHYGITYNKVGMYKKKVWGVVRTMNGVYSLTPGELPRTVGKHMPKYFVDVSFIEGKYNPNLPGGYTHGPTPRSSGGNTNGPTPRSSGGNTRRPTPGPTPRSSGGNTRRPTPGPTPRSSGGNTRRPTPGPTPRSSMGRRPTSAPTKATNLFPWRPTPAPTKPYHDDRIPNGARSAYCSVWPSSDTVTVFDDYDWPAMLSGTDDQRLTLGMRFETSEPGQVLAFRYFKATEEEGLVHSGRIYDWHSGDLLGTTGYFTDSSCPGPQWVSLSLTEPLDIEPHRQYVVAVDFVTHYVSTNKYFKTPITKGPITAHQGVLGWAPGFMPDNGAFDQSSYYVDLEFVPHTY